MTSCQYQLEDICVPITVEVEQTTFSANGGWVAGAFFLGLVLGALLTALLVRPCLREWQKKKRQDEEAGVASASPVIIAESTDTESKKEKRSKKKGPSLFKRKKKGREDASGEDNHPGKYRGMVDVIVQTSSVGADGELARQDLAAVAAMDDDQEQERETLYLRCLEGLVKKLVVKNMLSEDFCLHFLKRSRQDMADIKRLTQAEVGEAEEAARKDSKLSKDPQSLEAEMTNIQRQAAVSLSQRQREQREEMREDLIRSSGLSEAEVEALLEKLLEQMAVAEARLGQEHARQRKLLQERLAKRRQVLEYNQLQQDNQTEDIHAGVEMMDTLVGGLVTTGKLDGKQRDKLLQMYQEEVAMVRQHHQTEALRQRQSLVEKLQQRREKRLHKLAEKHEKERQDFVKTSNKGTATTQLVQGYHDLIVQQHRETEEASTDLDQEDVQELDKLVKESHSQEIADLEDRLGTQMAEVGRQANMDSKNVNQFLQQHKQQMDRYHNSKQREKQAMLARLQERLANRLQVVDQEQQEEEVQMGALVEQQTSTLKKVLATNIELSDEAQERILKEHEQNMLNLTNQLQTSKLRQQKSLEVKLSQRKSRLEALHQRQSELRLSRGAEKGREKLESELSKEIAVEEERLEQDRLTALAQLRHQLAEETEQVLRQHDQEMGLLIGRLQVGQARRQAILRKQDKTLKELQDQLEDRLTVGELPRSYTDQLIQQHHNQMAHLNDHIQRSREKQERVIIEKLQTKKHMKENQLETQMEEEAQVEYYQQQQRGTGLASSVLLQTLLEQRHDRAMADLEQEMKAELEKSKEELNTTLELELQQELESQKQQFLTQLAAVSGISHDDLHQAVDAAATETGMDQRKAKKLAKDLQAGIKRAKTDLSETYSDAYDDGYGEGLSYAEDVPSNQAAPQGRNKKKKKGLRKQPRPAYLDNYGPDAYHDDDNDDDF